MMQENWKGCMGIKFKKMNSETYGDKEEEVRLKEICTPWTAYILAFPLPVTSLKMVYMGRNM
jgi:hypothetical protein